VKPWVGRPKQFKPRQGRQKIANRNFFRPIRGFFDLDIETHGFTVGYWLARLRR
jgi:hypothetical protein